MGNTVSVINDIIKRNNKANKALFLMQKTTARSSRFKMKLCILMAGVQLAKEILNFRYILEKRYISAGGTDLLAGIEHTNDR